MELFAQMCRMLPEMGLFDMSLGFVEGFMLLFKIIWRHCQFLCCAQGEVEGAAFVFFAFGPDDTVVGVDDVPGDGET